MLGALIPQGSTSQLAPCGLRGCNNRPTPFPGRVFCMNLHVFHAYLSNGSIAFFLTYVVQRVDVGCVLQFHPFRHISHVTIDILVNILECIFANNSVRFGLVCILYIF